jgi:hypothetical protein
MKILTATNLTQGASPLDFNWCKEGEVLIFGFECTGGSWDDGCGCRRSLAGIKSHKACTTFLVTESPLTPTELETLIATALVQEGWHKPVDKAALRSAHELLYDVLQVAAHYPVGTILERHERQFFKRSP